jgi:hypothetical protein
MSYQTWVRGSDLRNWAETLQARQKLPALVRRLIHATIEKPILTQFPADEGTQRRGWDGVVQVSTGNAWVPSGNSVWEMGVDHNPKSKADDDYSKRTAAPGSLDIANTTFVFVTPRKWEGKRQWCDERRAEGKWRDVIAWDCDDLEQWLETAPSPDAWLARLLGKLPVGLRDLSTYWTSLAATSEPPLTPAIFLAGREKTKTDLASALAGPAAEISVSALSLQELRDFIAATTADDQDEAASATAARTLIVENRDAWNQLATTTNRLILIPSEQLQLDKAMIAEAVTAGHHVITQIPYTYLRSGVGVRLPRMDRWELQKAMEAAGFGEERSQRLAREAGGCVSVLVRLSSKFAAQVCPDWAKPDEAAALLPLVLLGAWADGREEDRKIVERFTGEPYRTIQNLATRWINQPDAPLRLIEGVYSFVSREDSWRLLSPLFTKDLLEEFSNIALEVLSEDDPRFRMPADERYLAGVRGIHPRFSSALREGIAESIALLGARGDQTPQGAPEGSSWRATVLVRKLFENATPKRWFSLAPLLPLLAEAAPDEFLSAIEHDLLQPSPTVTSLFGKSGDDLFSSSPHTHLMWALEVLAWDVSHLARVVLVLAELANIDTGGRTHPRPAGVLHDIFRFWYPQTAASIEERLQVLDLLAKRNPAAAWTLLRSLVRQGEDVASPGSKPRWRDYDSSQIREITYGDIDQQVAWVADRLLSLASSDTAKWDELTKDFARLPVALQEATQQWLDATDPESINQRVRCEIWSKLRHLVQEHRFFHDAFWALPAATVDKLAEIEKKWAPTDPVIRNKWLFDYGGHMEFGDTETPYEERERLIEAAQIAALREIFGAKGVAGISELACVAKAPHLVGSLSAKAGLIPRWEEILPAGLLPIGTADSAFALGYIGRRIATEGDAFVDNLPLENWTNEAAAEVAVAMDFNRKTWEMLRRRKPAAEAIYWNRVNPITGHLPEAEAEEAVRCLLNVRRPVIAASCAFDAYHAGKPLDWNLVADAVDAASLDSGKAESDIPIDQHFVWKLSELMKYLQEHPAADKKRIVKLEYRFLPLGRHSNFSPKTLHKELSRNPTFFAELIQAQFVSKAESENKNRIPDPARAPLAEAAYKLLDSWAGIPGARPDGSIDASVLKDWVQEARKLCAAIDRIEICDVMLGEQLSRAPADPDGLWPCQAVRDVLESVPTDKILEGFIVGVSNQRGVVSKSITEGGEQERELARKYKDLASKVKVSWPRTALTLRRIAERYELDARREDERIESRD